MPRPRQLNPAETAMYAADNARLPPEHQADVSLKWRERCIAVIQAHMNPVADGLSIVAAAGYTGLLGWWDGGNEGKRDDLVTTWRTVTAPELGIDPNAVREPFQDVYNAQGQLVGNVWSTLGTASGERRPWIEVGLLPAGIAAHVS